MGSFPLHPLSPCTAQRPGTRIPPVSGTPPPPVSTTREISAFICVFSPSLNFRKQLEVLNFSQRIWIWNDYLVAWFSCFWAGKPFPLQTVQDQGWGLSLSPSSARGLEPSRCPAGWDHFSHPPEQGCEMSENITLQTENRNNLQLFVRVIIKEILTKEIFHPVLQIKILF